MLTAVLTTERELNSATQFPSPGFRVSSFSSLQSNVRKQYFHPRDERRRQNLRVVAHRSFLDLDAIRFRNHWLFAELDSQSHGLVWSMMSSAPCLLVRANRSQVSSSKK